MLPRTIEFSLSLHGDAPIDVCAVEVSQYSGIQRFHVAVGSAGRILTGLVAISHRGGLWIQDETLGRKMPPAVYCAVQEKLTALSQAQWVAA